MYNRNINKLTAVIQSPIAPRSTNVLWDDLVSNTLKVYRKGIWTVIGGAGGGGEGSSLYWGYDEIQGVIFTLDNRSVQINGDLTVNGTIKTFGLEINGKPFEQYWELDSNTNTLSTTYQVLIKNSLIVEQDASSGGDGQDTPGGSGGVSEEDVLDILEKNNYITSSALSSYYTKAQSDARYLALSGGEIKGDLSLNQYLRINAWAGYGSGSANAWYNGNTQMLLWENVSGIGLGSNIVIHSGNIGSYAPIYNASGNVTIGASDLAGTSAYAKLCIDGVLAMPKDDTRVLCSVLGFSEGNLYLGYSNISTYDTIVSGKNILFNPSGGNVGIGTTSPEYKLDVNGNIKGVNIFVAENNGMWLGSQYTASLTSDDLAIVGSKVWFFGDVSARNNLDTRGTFAASGAATFGSTLSVSGAVTMSSTLSVGGGATVSGALNGTQIRLSNYIPLVFTNQGSGTYTQAVVEYTSSGFVFERARKTDSGSGEIIPLIISQRGGGVAAKFDGNNFSVTGDTNIGGNLVVSGDVASA